MDIDIDALKKGISRQMTGETFTEEVLLKFVDYVAYLPRMHAFNKVKFVAATNHLIIRCKPQITKYFTDPMPGMSNYPYAGAMPAQPPSLQTNPSLGM